jgi:ABC-type antimicrobial peptide transport system permease subunit
VFRHRSRADPVRSVRRSFRTARRPAALKEPLRLALQQLDQDLTVSQTLTMEEYVAQFFVGINVFNTVLGGFGIMALLLAALGTYGVLAYSVNQRRREIGIRMAVGARSSQLIRMIARQGDCVSRAGFSCWFLVLVLVWRQPTKRRR